MSTDFINKHLTEIRDPEDKVTAFQHVLSIAREGSSKRIRDSEYNRRFYEGEHDLTWINNSWQRKKRQKGLSWSKRATGEDAYQLLHEILPILLNSKPSLVVAPEDDYPIDMSFYFQEQYIERISEMDPYEASQSINDIMSTMDKREGRKILDSNITLESLIAGIAFVGFQRVNKGGISGFRPYLVHPTRFLYDPDCMSIHNFMDCRYGIIEEWLPADMIERVYGVKEEEYVGKSRGRVHRGVVGTISEGLARLETMYQGIMRGQDIHNLGKFPVHTVYYDPETPIGVGDTEAPQESTMQEMVFINENTYVPNSQRPNPYYHKEIPIVPFVVNPSPFRVQGTSELAQYVSTQIMINLAQEALTAASLHNAFPPMNIEDGAIDKDSYDFSPGAINTWNNNALAAGQMRENAPRDTASIATVFQLMKTQLRERGHDAQGTLAGAVPSNIKSAKHFNAALQSVMTIHGYRVEMLDPSWYRMKRMEVSNFQQFEQVNRSLVNKLKDISHEYQYLVDSLKNLRYDIEIDSKSKLPADLATRLEIYMVLYQAGMSTLKDFYEQTEIPVSRETLDSVDAQNDVENMMFGVPPAERAALDAQIDQNIDAAANLLQ